MQKAFLKKVSAVLQKNNGRSRIIAVAGVSPGVGTTHSVLLLANYLRRQRLKVGVVELGNKGHLEQIEKAYEGMGFEPGASDSFKIKQVTYHKQVTGGGLMSLYKASFDVLILDIGSDLNTYGDDFQMADLSLVIGQTTDWKQQEISTFLIGWNHLLGPRSKWLLPFADEEEVRTFSRQHGQRGQCLGYCHDPFVKDKTIDRQLASLLQ